MATPRGRPPKLTPETAKAVVDAVAAGLPRKFAALAAGVSESTLRAWLARGRRDKEGEYLAFLAGVKKAEGEAVARNVGLVQRAAAERDEVTVKEVRKGDGVVERTTTTRRVFDWTAAAWWLERRHPGAFASNRHELKELRARLAELAAAVGATGGGSPTAAAEGRPAAGPAPGGGDGGGPAGPVAGGPVAPDG